MMKVIVQKVAAKQIDQVYDYGELHFGRRAAEKLHTSIVQSMRLLQLQPYIGVTEPLLAGRKYVYRSFVVHKHFKLIYYINEEVGEIYIADLWDTRREPLRQAEPLK